MMNDSLINDVTKNSDSDTEDNSNNDKVENGNNDDSASTTFIADANIDSKTEFKTILQNKNTRFNSRRIEGTWLGNQLSLNLLNSILKY